MKEEITGQKLRSFGLMVGGIFGVIALWPLVIRSAQPRWWAAVIAVCLLVPALLYPKSLYWPHKQWMALGHILGWINTRVILGVIFFLVVTPIGVVRRWLGRDPMGRRFRPDLRTYRVERNRRPPSHLRNQY
jgi:hypothetical protein